MQHYNSDPQPWYIVPVKPGADARFHRWDLLIISILAALVLGLFFAVVIPQTSGSAVHNAPAKVHSNPAAAALG